MYRITEGLGELVDPVGRQEEPGGAYEVFLSQEVIRDALAFDLLLQQQNAV
jgi:hypothetical protein